MWKLRVIRKRLEAVEIVKYLQTAGKDGSSNDKRERFVRKSLEQQPSMHTEISRELRSRASRSNTGTIKFHSNGGVRLNKFWTRLGELLTPERRGTCIFALDGLEDTLHLYRQNVKYRVVERNARSFIAAGGRAVWKFIVFAHNEHQVDEARIRSEAFGFDRFQVVKTKRFFKKRTGAVK